MPPPGAPLRVLIVEDERIQQRIIRDMLERLGAIVETAGTGREAVESVRKGPDRFGAILMDMLMPEMDGIEAARIIRREFPDHAVPIIATTASAQPAEIDACLAAGMNGHVSKPFDVRQLEAALSRWTKLAPTGRGTQAEHPDARAQGGPADLSAVKGVDTASALARLNGHRDLFVRLLKGFVEDYRSAPASIGAAIARGDLDAALRMAHNLKGVAGTLSANAVYGAARALEASLREGRHHELAELVERLSEELDTVCRSVADWATEHGAATGRAGRRSSGPSAAAAALAEFDRRLKTRRFSAREQFEVVKEHAADPGCEHALDAVQGCLDRLDFQQARELLPALATALGVPFSLS